MVATLRERMAKRKAKAVKMQEQGTALSQQADCLTVCEILQHRSDMVATLKQKCIDTGLIDKSIGEINDEKLMATANSSFIKKTDIPHHR